MRRSGRMGARILAVGALVSVTVALLVLVSSAPTERGEAAGPTVSTLAVPMEQVDRRLADLQPAQSARPAQRAVRRAMDAATRLKAGTEVLGDERVTNAIERTIEYLDAVGSLLSNPRSPLRSELEERATRARAALGAAPGGESARAAVRGWQRLLTR